MHSAEINPLITAEIQCNGYGSTTDGDQRKTVAIPRGATPSSCPVQALRDWLDRSETRFGPVFRKIDRWGTLENNRLGADAIRRILARRSGKNRRRRTSTAAA